MASVCLCVMMTGLPWLSLCVCVCVCLCFVCVCVHFIDGSLGEACFLGKACMSVCECVSV